jgi:hypothetical protein
MCLSHLIYTVRPCLIHTCHTMPMQRPCHVLTMPFFSMPRHSTAVERRPVGYLPAFGFFRLPRGVPRRLLSEANQSSSQRSIPTTVKSGSSKLQKRRSVKLLDLQFGYFRLPRGLSRRTRHCRSRAGVRHGMCELTARHGRGMAWARHAMFESALSVPAARFRPLLHSALSSVANTFTLMISCDLCLLPAHFCDETDARNFESHKQIAGR